MDRASTCTYAKFSESFSFECHSRKIQKRSYDCRVSTHSLIHDHHLKWWNVVSEISSGFNFSIKVSG